MILISIFDIAGQNTIYLGSGGRLLAFNIETGVTSTVCSNYWEDADATVVCKQLGLGTSGRATNIYQDYNYTRSMFNVYCTGYEYSLFDCSYDTSDMTGMCYSANDAAVECTNKSTNNSTDNNTNNNTNSGQYF